MAQVYTETVLRENNELVGDLIRKMYASSEETVRVWRKIIQDKFCQLSGEKRQAGLDFQMKILVERYEGMVRERVAKLIRDKNEGNQVLRGCMLLGRGKGVPEILQRSTALDDHVSQLLAKVGTACQLHLEEHHKKDAHLLKEAELASPEEIRAMSLA